MFLFFEFLFLVFLIVIYILVIMIWFFKNIYNNLDMFKYFIGKLFMQREMFQIFLYLVKE